MNPLLQCGNIRHKQLVRILCLDFRKELLEAFAIGSVPSSGIERYDVQTFPIKFINFMNSRCNENAAVGKILFYDANDWQIHFFFDRLDVLRSEEHTS